MKKLLLIQIFLTITLNISFGEELPEKYKTPKEGSRYSITWGGHSTVLININGKLILTDPLLTNSVAGITKRKTDCKLDIDEMKKPDVILLSHSHFDHLCMNSLKILEEKYPGSNIIFPEGVEDFLPDMDFKMHRLSTNKNFKNSIIGESKTIDGVKITSVYAKHSGGRYGIDSYFWEDKGHTGFIIEYNGVTIFYSGDTGYDEKAFKKLGNLYKIDAALIQTGPCFDCDEKGSDEHASSIESLNIFLDLQASYMVPVHYGSIEYDTDADYPVRVLKEIINRKYKSLVTAGTSENDYERTYYDRIIVLDEGENISLVK